MSGVLLASTRTPVDVSCLGARFNNKNLVLKWYKPAAAAVKAESSASVSAERVTEEPEEGEGEEVEKAALEDEEEDLLEREDLEGEQVR